MVGKLILDVKQSESSLNSYVIVNAVAINHRQHLRSFNLQREDIQLPVLQECNTGSQRFKVELQSIWSLDTTLVTDEKNTSTNTTVPVISH
jgi:hypothetical protein